MKKNSKVISIFVAMALAATPVIAKEIYEATVNQFKVMVDNQDVDIEGYNINGYTYFKLRDIGDEVGFEVDFKDDNIMISTGVEEDTDVGKEFKKYNTFSILGDSYSTYTEFVEPATNAVWYPSKDNTPNDVKDVNDTWMKLFEKEYGANLVMNNSYSGSPICYDGYGSGETDSTEFSYVKRVENIEPAELIIVEGATNDCWAGAQIGEYKYSDWTEEDLTTFRPALAYVLDYMKNNYSDSDIVFMLNNGLTPEIIESVETICDYYNVPLLKLDDISKRSDHPNKQGMMEICNQLIDFLTK